MYNDNAKDLADSSYFANDEKSVSYLNQAAFLQGVVRFRLLNIIAGARYDNHSVYGSAFVPRLGLTKKINNLHFKLLYSKAFRAPSIENINLMDSTGIKPEYTTVAELEIGYEIRRNSIITVNLFDINTTNAIVYYYNDQTNMEAYHNAGDVGSGSRGLELEYKIKDRWGYVNFNYSFYTVAGKPKIPDYEVPESKTSLLAFPNHKLNLNMSFNLTKHLNINPSVSYRGERYAYTSIDTSGNAVIEKLDPLILANFLVTYNDLFIKGLSLGVGVYDIFDQKITYIQPYNSNHAPLPGPSREILVKLSYAFTAKKKTKE
jgi:outer membrane receptor for ferrienterochelin and colicin